MLANNYTAGTRLWESKIEIQKYESEIKNLKWESEIRNPKSEINSPSLPPEQVSPSPCL